MLTDIASIDDFNEFNMKLQQLYLLNIDNYNYKYKYVRHTLYRGLHIIDNNNSLAVELQV